MMMIPRRNFDLFDDMFNDSFFKGDNKIMKTDIKDNKDNYIIDIEMPGYEKENIKIDVEDGYLNVTASINKDNDESNDNYVRKERYVGECSRSFYIGDNIEAEDIKANFKNGILSLNVPKINKEEVPTKKYVQIED